MITSSSTGDHDTEIPKSPLPSYSRIESLDVIRGVAVLGALFVSIWIFGGFSNQQQNQLLVISKGWNYRVYGAMELLLDGKMRALIAIVFGAAMIIFLNQTSKATVFAGELFIRRQMWLILFGLINAFVFLWTHDLLFHLGIMGILLFPFVRMSYRGLFIAAILTTLIYCGKNFWNYADKKDRYQKFLSVTALEKKYEKDSIALGAKGTVKAKDTLTKLEKQDKQAWEGTLANMKVDVKKDEGNIKAMHNLSYGKTWNHLLEKAQSREAQWTYQFGIWDLASMIFLGMALYKTRFFHNRFSSSKYFIIAIVCIAAGLLLGWFRLHYLQVSLHDFTKYIKGNAVPHDIFFPIERALLALGYACLLIFFLSVNFLSGIWTAFSSAGKLALSNYLLQSLICTIFFYGYGMGYYARLSQFQLYIVAAEVILVQLVLSVIWLKYYKRGPAEWLLHKLYYGHDAIPDNHTPGNANPPVTVIS
ncbi:MAG: DUF418 domain-containing protein [Ferruginibacter sp.]